MAAMVCWQGVKYQAEQSSGAAGQKRQLLTSSSPRAFGASPALKKLPILNCGRGFLVSLQAKLNAFKAQVESGAPPYNITHEAVAITHRETDELKRSGLVEQA
jgi:hypothetical protein